MKITEIKLYRICAGNSGEKGVRFGESHYWDGGWATHSLVAAILAARPCDVIQPKMQWCGGLTAVRRIAAMAKPYDIPVIPHGASIYNYHFVQSNLNSPFAEYLSVGDGTSIRHVFDSIIGEPMPVRGCVTLDDSLGFGVELNRDYLKPIIF